MGRASKDKRDIYYRKAKEEGYRARSAYKLLQIHEEFNILNAHDITTGAVDLCAAPGSWCQVLSGHFRRIEAQRKAAASGDADDEHGYSTLKPRIVAVDLQEMAPVDGVRIVQGDITSEATAREIIRLLNADSDDDDDDGETHGERDHHPERDEESGPVPGSSSSPGAPSTTAGLRKADIVVCDGAPDVTGMHELDENLQHHLLLAALTITTAVLRPGGTFVTKMFRGPNTPFLVAKSELFFDQVRVVKPKSSRNASMECFLLCQNFRLPEGYVPRLITDAAEAQPLSTSSPAVTNDPVGGGAHLTADAPVYTYRSENSPTPVSAAPRTLLPFVSCGDLSGFDADMCYDRSPQGGVLAPVQPPLQAPYLPQDRGDATATAVPETKRPRKE